MYRYIKMMSRSLGIVAIISLLASIRVQAASNPVLVTCGSTIKLENQKTKHFLHSHDVHYGGGRGSGQQSVTGYPERNSGNDFWIVRGAYQGDYCIQGTPIKKGTVIRLQHGATRRFLHSHPFFSPLSNMQEVSCFGNDAESNDADNWIVEWDGKEEYWQQDSKISLKHQVSQSHLSNHQVEYQRPIPGQTEVFANRFQKKDDMMIFKATEGIFFPTNSRNLS